MLWYVLQKYVYVLLGKNHLDGPEEEMESPPSPSKHIHLTSQELHGLKGIVLYLHQLQAYRKNVPEIIKDPVALIKDVRTLIELHCGDNPAQAVTGRSVLTGIEDSEVNTNNKINSINYFGILGETAFYAKSKIPKPASRKFK